MARSVKVDCTKAQEAHADGNRYRLWITEVQSGGSRKAVLKLENVRNSLQPARYRAVGLVEKSTAARERYIQPRLGQQGSELAVKQICMRSLGAVFLRGTRAEQTGKQRQTDRE